MPPRRAGFTLVEVMVVVMIIGLLATLAIPAMTRARRDTVNACFANDINRIAHAFEQYAVANAGYPPDRTPAVIPPGMPAYMPNVDWNKETVIGGLWDWDHEQFGYKAGVSVFMPNRTVTQMEAIDAVLDDGDLTTGLFRARAQGYIYIIEF